MKTNIKSLELIEKGMTAKTVSKLTESQVNILHSRLIAEATDTVTKQRTYSSGEVQAMKEKGQPMPGGKEVKVNTDGSISVTTEGEVSLILDGITSLKRAISIILLNLFWPVSFSLPIAFNSDIFCIFNFFNYLTRIVLQEILRLIGLLGLLFHHFFVKHIMHKVLVHKMLDKFHH